LENHAVRITSFARRIALFVTLHDAIATDRCFEFAEGGASVTRNGIAVITLLTGTANAVPADDSSGNEYRIDLFPLTQHKLRLALGGTAITGERVTVVARFTRLYAPISTTCLYDGDAFPCAEGGAAIACIEVTIIAILGTIDHSVAAARQHAPETTAIGNGGAVAGALIAEFPERVVCDKVPAEGTLTIESASPRNGIAVTRTVVALLASVYTTIAARG
jgi:hypothetical protein